MLKNNSNKQLILVGLLQFGYRSDTDKFCENLADEFKITYVCFDEGWKKKQTHSINVCYINPRFRLLRKLRLLVKIITLAIKQRRSVIYITYFRLSSLITFLFPFQKVIIDFRTGSVSSNKFKNWFKNRNMLIESFFFKHIVTISEDLKKHLRLPKRAVILPLGSDIISHTSKSFDSIKLLYVGTLRGRNIHETIRGAAEFIEKYPNVYFIYNIIGRGETSDLYSEIEKYNLESKVKVLGYIPEEQIESYYDNSNIGVCYAPMSDYYMAQPFTKLYEYTMSGMAIISVRLMDSIRRVDPNIGVLCDDNPESFSSAIEQLYLNRLKYNSEHIRKEFSAYTWKQISKQFRSIIDD